MGQIHQKRLPDGERVMPIAIVGMGCRYPGGVTDPEKLWEMCAEQRDAWSPIPKERFNADEFYHPDPSRNGTSNIKGAHFLKDHPGYFDAPFFNLTHAEASAMDPQQRLLLECSYEALENAGIITNQIAGSDTAVFMASSCRDYTDLLLHDPDRTELYQATGTGQTMLANRISYFYDLNGPSISVDTACSSSLVALHLACSAIRSGESKMAIVGGSNLILGPAATVALSMLRFLSPDGRCYSFDERGNGFGRGEGAACIVLKPLDDALKAGDTIRAVIRNSGTNQDGKTSGITLPSGQAQFELIQNLYKSAGIDPLETSYVEAHGTGTQAGDPIEAASLSKIFLDGIKEETLMVGSIKSNIGHLEGGSGIAGVVKTVLMLEKNRILPNFNFTKPNPRIPMKDWKITIPTSVLPWLSHGTRRASVNNFGFGGSNAHVIIEEGQSNQRSKNKAVNGVAVHPLQNGNHVGVSHHRTRLFVLSAHDKEAGKRQAIVLSEYLQGQPEKSEAYLDNLALTLCERRSTHSWRTSVPADSTTTLIEGLSAESIKFSKSTKNAVLGFVFTGQGAQWHAMGRELIPQYPVFRESLVRAEGYLKDLGASWSLIDELMRDKDTFRAGSALLSQPLCTAIQIALVDLLSSWNIKPASVTGHSSGEIAAAYAAGVLTMESALAVAYHRGVAASQIKYVKELGAGAMLAVGLSAEETAAFILNVKNGVVNVACINSPSSVTVSGDESGIDELLESIKETGAFARKLAVDTAYHSRHMTHVAESYLDALENLPMKSAGEVEFYSSVSGKRAQDFELNAKYWVANLVSPVQFSQSLQNLCLGSGSKRRKRRGAKAAVDVLIEIGPHSALSGPIKQCLQAKESLSLAGIEYLSVLVRNKDAVKTSLGVAGSLFRKGVATDLHAINFPTGSKISKVLVNLPPYPWNHSTLYWANSLPSPINPNLAKTFSRNDFLGTPIRGLNSLEPRWRNIMRLSEIPWMQDHNIQSSTVCPAACYLAMAIEASYQRATMRGTEVTGYRLREITIGHALVFSQATDEVEIMLSLRPFNESVRFTSDVWDEFCISSSTDGTAWTEHCRGLISIEKMKTTTEVDGGREAREQSEEYDRMIVEFEEACTKEVDTHEIYSTLKELGLNFGPTFANMIKARVSADKSVAEVLIPDTAAIMPAKFEYPFIVHPATLDSFIHAVFPVGEGHKDMNQGTPVPTFIADMFVSHDIAKKPGHSFTIYAKGERKDLGNSASKGLGRTINTLSVFDSKQDRSEPVVTVTGLAFSALPRESTASSEQAKNLCHRIQWDAAPEFLTAKQLDTLAAPFRLPAAVKDQGQLIQQAAFYYAENAVKTVALEEIPETEVHLRKLYSLIKRRCDEVYQGHSERFETSHWLKADEASRTEICDAVLQTPYEILCHIGKALPQIFRKKIDPLSVMMEDHRLERHYRDNQLLAQSYQQAAVYIRILANKNPFLNVLEIGAGTGGATFPALEAMIGPDGPRFANYDFTDISPGFFETVKEKIQHHSQHLSDLINFRKLDIEADPQEQGYELGSYDLIIAANVLHATRDMKKTMAGVRSLLKPGGKLVLFEITVQNLAASVVFGTLPGWWVGEEPSRYESPLSTEEEWEALLRESKFSGLDAVLWDTPDVENHNVSAMISTAIGGTEPAFPTEVIIVTEAIPPDPYVSNLQILLQSLGVSSTLSCLADCDPKGQACIVLNELTQPILRDPTLASFNAVKRILVEGSGTLWVTRGAHMESASPDLNLAMGLARTVRAEKGDTMLVTLDLDPQTPSNASERSVAATIFAVFKRNFCLGSMELPNLDTEYVIRDDVFMIPRVVEDKKLTSFVASTTGTPVPESQSFVQPGRPLRAEIKTPGFLDSLQFVDDKRMSGPLLDDYVEIEVKAIGMNFRDVMSASGQIDPYPLGCECSGVVTAIGKSVQDFVVGDHVISNALGGCVCNFVRSPAVGVEHILHDMPFAIAASLPIIYFTAYYAVMKVARLSKGETILVHAAAGGLGQAIINLAQLVGAEIFATVGTLEKRKLLIQKFDIPEDHIFSSRDDTFAKGVMRRTGGRGVDVIMNSLSGDALRQTWNCIAPFGRFVELGKRDFTVNSRLEMKHFEKNVSFTGLDVPLHTNFNEKRRIWGEIMSLYQKGDIKPPYPITAFGISEIEKAMRIMQTGKHSGKLVIVPRPDEIVKVLPKKDTGDLLKADGSYLLIGGLGGIGRALAFWMVEQGAKHLIFASPSGLDKEKARECVASLKEKGVNIAVFKCDVSNLKDVQRMVDDSASRRPPIRGMIHTAMVPKADLFEKLSLSDYNSTIGVKVHGTWNLHNALSTSPLDFFILLSSMVGAVGNPSQAAYVAANLFLDAFADFRNSQGLPAVSLALGRVVDIGFVSENEEMQRAVSHLWSRDVTPEEVISVVKSAIVEPMRQERAGSSIVGMKEWGAEATPVYNTPLFSHYRRAALKSKSARGQEGGAGTQIREMLKQATSLDDAAAKTCDAVMTKMSVLLMIPLEDISSSKSMSSYGMDSLVAVEMRNWLVRELDVTLPVLELLANTSVAVLARKIVVKSKLTNPAILKGGDN